MPSLYAPTPQYCISSFDLTCLHSTYHYSHPLILMNRASRLALRNDDSIAPGATIITLRQH